MMITIFTPTYNRADLLPRLYHSLLNQTDHNFEWIVIDDASTDDTEKILKSYISENRIRIHYEKQEHGGKHRAINRALQIANGSMFFIVDSDDYLTNDAIELVRDWSSTIINDSMIAGVAGLCKSISSNSIIGGVPLIKDYIDATNFERARYNLLGDKAEVYKTDIIKKYPFPEFEGEFFVTESVCWDAIASDGYKLRWFNKAIYCGDYLVGGLTNSGANEYEGRKKYFQGYCFYIRQCLRIMRKTESVYFFRQYNITCEKMGMNISDRATGLNMSTIGYIVYLVILHPVFYIARDKLKKDKGKLI